MAAATGVASSSCPRPDSAISPTVLALTSRRPPVWLDLIEALEQGHDVLQGRLFSCQHIAKAESGEEQDEPRAEHRQGVPSSQDPDEKDAEVRGCRKGGLVLGRDHRKIRCWQDVFQRLCFLLHR